MTKEHRRFNLQPYLRREPVTLAVLTVLAIIAFGAVAGISRLFHQQQDALAVRWSTRGTKDLNARRYAAAVIDFRTALLYSRDNFSFQLSLAEALIGESRIDEAYAYLVSLWQRQPENGLVNLEMARIAAARGRQNDALRYYSNAIYAIWPNNPDQARLSTRLEFIHYLLSINNRAQADSELIAMAGNLGDDSKKHTMAGELFLKTQDDQRALEQFRLALSRDRHNVRAMAGAGQAAFNLQQYRLAERYLREAVDAGDKASLRKLRISELILETDPFRPQVTVANRDRIVLDAFVAAGNRLKACGTQGSTALPAATLSTLTQNWAKLKPKITLYQLRRNPDLVSTAMSVVFSIERQTNGLCGGTTDTDTALLLIANLHEGL